MLQSEFDDHATSLCFMPALREYFLQPPERRHETVGELSLRFHAAITQMEVLYCIPPMPEKSIIFP